MRKNNNWDICPKWVRFKDENRRPNFYTGWDVCPHWVRFGNRETNSVENDCPEKCKKEKQKHVHEFLGSTKIARERSGEFHNHRFAGVSGEAIPSHGSHIHRICTKTDFFDHLHEIEDFTGPAIDIGNGKHIHFDRGETTFNDGHDHDFQFATLIESPLLSGKRY